MYELTNEANEGLEQVGFRAFGVSACTLDVLGLYFPDDRAGWILRAGNEVLVRVLPLQVDHWCQSLMCEIVLDQCILRLVRLLARTGQQLVQGVRNREAVIAVRANCDNTVSGMTDNRAWQSQPDLQYISLRRQWLRPFQETAPQAGHSARPDP